MAGTLVAATTHAGDARIFYHRTRAVSPWECPSTETDHRAGPGRSIELVLPARRSWGNTAGRETEHDSESHERSVRHNAALPDRIADGDALALGEPGAERVGARSDCGACAQRAFDRGEPKERRPHGCADAGSAGANRSAVVVSGEAWQREGAGGSDGPLPSCRWEREVDNQVAAPAETRTPNLHRANITQ
jgi:hypothetical protein